MSKIFQRNDIINLIALMPYALLARLYSILYGTPYVPLDYDTVISKYLFGTVMTSNLIQSVAGVVVVYIQASLLILLTNNHKLYQTPYGFIGPIYLLLISGVIPFQQFTPALLALVFVILSAFSVFQVYKKNNATTHIFNAGLMIAIAALIYAPFIWLAIALLIEMTVLRNFKIRERFQFLIGVGVLYWIVGSVYYYFGMLDFGFTDRFEPLHVIPSMLESNWYEKLVVFIWMFFTLLTLANFFLYKKKKGIAQRKKIDFFYYLMLIAFIATCTVRCEDYGFLQLLCIPLAVLFSMNIYNVKNQTRLNFIHLLMILIVFLSLYSIPLELFSN